MKKHLKKSLVIMSLLAMSIPVIAGNNSSSATSGMKIVTGPTLARASEFVGGGRWDYGINVSGMLYSGYFHKTNKHSATASSVYQTLRDIQPAGVDAYAEVPKSGSAGTDKVYWNNDVK